MSKLLEAIASRLEAISRCRPKRVPARAPELANGLGGIFLPGAMADWSS